MTVRKFDRWGNTWTTQNGCAFGCHTCRTSSRATIPPSIDPLHLCDGASERREDAHRRGARRIGKLGQSLLSREDKRYKVAIHTFHSSFATLQAATDNPTTAAAAIAKIAPSTRQGGTNATSPSRPAFGGSARGDGMTKDKPKAIVVLMTTAPRTRRWSIPNADGITWGPYFVPFLPRRGLGRQTSCPSIRTCANRSRTRRPRHCPDTKYIVRRKTTGTRSSRPSRPGSTGNRQQHGRLRQARG